MNDDELIKYNRMGFIPGPKENEEEFLARVNFCLTLKEEVLAKIPLPNSAPMDENMEQRFLAPGMQITHEIYDIAPAWIPLFFSNWKIYPWHGGVAWIFEMEKGAPLGAFLQIRKAFYTKPILLKLYHRDEIIAHELCHVGRMAFEEKKFEELIAYRTSNRPFSRYFGPLLQSAFESRLIVYIIVTLLVMDLFILMLGSVEAYFDLFMLKAIPILLIFWGLYRLRQRNHTFDKTADHLKSIWGKWGQAVFFRLTDEEIEKFAKMHLEEIKHYAETEPSLRWRTIRIAYGKP